MEIIENYFKFLVPLSISVLALFFTVASFWWMNWRKGNIATTSPRSYAAKGSENDKLIIELPFVFFNTGARPIIVQNLRLKFQDPSVDQTPLFFNATVEKIGTDEGRKFATQFPVRGQETIVMICEFQRKPGKLVFQAKEYLIHLQAILDDGSKWKTIGAFSLNVAEKSLQNINRIFIVYDNHEGANGL